MCKKVFLMEGKLNNNNNMKKKTYVNRNSMDVEHS